MSSGKLLSMAGKRGADGGALVSLLLYIAGAQLSLRTAYSAAVCHPAHLCTVNPAGDVCRRYRNKQSEQADGKLAKPARSQIYPDYAVYDDALFSGTAERNDIDPAGN